MSLYLCYLNIYIEKMTTIEELKARIMGGGSLTEEEAYSLLDTPDKDDCFL